MTSFNDVLLSAISCVYALVVRNNKNSSIELEWYIWQSSTITRMKTGASTSTRQTQKKTPRRKRNWRKKEKEEATKKREKRNFSSKWICPCTVVSFHACMHDQWLLVDLPCDILRHHKVIITFSTSFSLFEVSLQRSIHSLEWIMITYDDYSYDWFLIKQKNNGKEKNEYPI
jgi:hypothetical protein